MQPHRTLHHHLRAHSDWRGIVEEAPRYRRQIAKMAVNHADHDTHRF